MPDTESSEEYRKKYLVEQERLAKLWDAYQIQETALKEVTDTIRSLETDAELKEKEVLSLNEMLEKRDKQLREMEREITHLQKITADYKPKLESCSEALKKEKDKLAKLYDVAQELDEELNIKNRALEVRDKWFMDNVGVFESMCQTIKERKEIAEARMLKEEMVKKMSAGGDPTDLKKAGIISELSSLESVDEDVAKHLYEAGFTSLDLLKKARMFELVAVEGIGPTTAKAIFQDVKKL
jgi:chromosome segregation ATPase